MLIALAQTRLLRPSFLCSLAYQLNEILNSIEKNETEAIILQGKEGVRLGVNQIPEPHD